MSNDTRGPETVLEAPAETFQPAVVDPAHVGQPDGSTPLTQVTQPTVDEQPDLDNLHPADASQGEAHD